MKVTRLGPPRIRQNTIRVGGIVFDRDTLAPLTVKESDGTPSVTPVSTLVFDGATVTDDTAGQATVTIPPVGIVGVRFPITAVFDAGTAAISGNPDVDIVAPANGQIVEWVLLGDQTGDAVIDIWRDTYANAPPADADSITGGNEPTLTAAVKATDATLTGWTTAFSAGDVFRVHLDSSTAVARLQLTLIYERT